MQTNELEIKNAYDTPFPLRQATKEECDAMLSKFREKKEAEMTREQMYEAMAEIEEARTVDAIEAAAAKAGVLKSPPGLSGWDKNAPTYDFFRVDDPTVMAVLRRYEARSAEGMKTYGTSMSDNQSDLEFWLRSAQEEAMDLSLYLERAIDEIQRQKTKKEFVYESLPLSF